MSLLQDLNKSLAQGGWSPISDESLGQIALKRRPKEFLNVPEHARAAKELELQKSRKKESFKQRLKNLKALEKTAINVAITMEDESEVLVEFDVNSGIRCTKPYDGRYY